MFSDENAVSLLALLVDYFDAYGKDGSLVSMRVDELAGDLIDSLPYGALPPDGIGYDLHRLGLDANCFK